MDHLEFSQSYFIEELKGLPEPLGCLDLGLEGQIDNILGIEDLILDLNGQSSLDSDQTSGIEDDWVGIEDDWSQLTPSEDRIHEDFQIVTSQFKNQTEKGFSELNNNFGLTLSLDKDSFNPPFSDSLSIKSQDVSRCLPNSKLDLKCLVKTSTSNKNGIQKKEESSIHKEYLQKNSVYEINNTSANFEKDSKCKLSYNLPKKDKADSGNESKAVAIAQLPNLSITEKTNCKNNLKGNLKNKNSNSSRSLLSSFKNCNRVKSENTENHKQTSSLRSESRKSDVLCPTPPDANQVKCKDDSINTDVASNASPVKKNNSPLTINEPSFVASPQIDNLERKNGQVKLTNKESNNLKRKNLNGILKSSPSKLKKHLGCFQSIVETKTKTGTAERKILSRLGYSGECKDKRLVREEITQPVHLKFNKPTNSELWKMRRINDSHLAGFNTFRGDFETEYDNNAEEMLCLAGQLNNYNTVNKMENISQDKEETKLFDELQIALTEGYNSRLNERQERKRIITQHGLINQRGTQVWFTRLETALGKSNAKKIIRFTRLINPEEAESLYTSLGSLNERRAEANKMIYYRTQLGITSKISLEMFESERKKREPQFERVDVRNVVMPSTVKRKKSFVQIFHLPRFRELSTKEADLCSVSSLTPQFFLDTKDMLIADCKKSNGLLLKKARKLVKIDVNKTRKIFDLLMEQGHIWPPGFKDKDSQLP